MATQSKPYKQGFVPSLIINGLVAGMMFIFLLGGAYVGYVFYYTVKNAVVKTNLPGLPSLDLALPIASAALPLTGNTEDSADILSISGDGSTQQPVANPVPGEPVAATQSQKRINILLLGTDQRPDEVYARTDTMILVTIDPNTKSAGMLSIPRDLWVSIPGYDEDRINKAHFNGDRYKYPGGGPALAMKTVQYNLGVPVHYYAKIDFNGFIEMVDTLGGIDIYVPETIDDPKFPDSNYGYDPFYIEAGQQTLDGHDAMRYARTRATPGADFSRAKRQQQVLLAMKDKALQVGIIPKIPELWATMSDTIETDLDLAVILELAQMADDIGTNNIQNQVIGFKLTVNYIVPDTGAQVLLPLRDKIKVVIDEMFAETEPQQPTSVELEADRIAQEAEQTQAQADAEAQAEVQAQAEVAQEAQRQEELKTFLAQEEARVVIQNGTNIINLASQTALYLKNQGFNIVQFSPADSSNYPHTVIVVYVEEKNYTLDILKTRFKVQEENIRRSPNLKSDVDFRVIIGSDFDIPEEVQLELTSQ